MSIERMMEFAGNHPGLMLAFFALQGMLMWTVFQGGGGGRRLSPSDATRLINHEDAVIVDVRPDAEFGQGHILNAVHIPEAKLSDQLGKLRKYKQRPIITTCRTGQLSMRASNVLRKNGFENVYNLAGGLAAWEGANLPLTKK